MIKKKKSGFITFCCSLFPGAGEMYLGFMKMGVSLMSLFIFLMILGNMLNIDSLLSIGIIVWFYSFFHVHNLAGLTENEYMNTKDEFLFNFDKILDADKKNIEKYRKVIAIILILFGTLLLWQGIKAAFLPLLPDFILRVISRMENTVPQILAGIGIIIGGFYMIKGKKEDMEEVIIDVTDENTEREASVLQNMEAERMTYGRETDKQDS